MNQEEVVDLMRTSATEDEWNANADKVKRACGGYPIFWYQAVVLSGVMNETVAKFGGSSEIRVSSIAKGADCNTEEGMAYLRAHGVAVPSGGAGNRSDSAACHLRGVRSDSPAPCRQFGDFVGAD